MRGNEAAVLDECFVCHRWTVYRRRAVRAKGKTVLRGWCGASGRLAGGGAAKKVSDTNGTVMCNLL